MAKAWLVKLKGNLWMGRQFIQIRKKPVAFELGNVLSTADILTM